ncbi:TlpA disulfide reductase family protein [Humisphaera borealis]|uniref:Redoxin family protein n=1 Tax=Humisphaera borealis TaxID=2807512 RepID=A0A7M2WPC5_9BACT|nr:TlpA disulfide reductase family protein [Humisphaera borealis]QOV87318.1 redoxin family protein [Humisphaera borealis]
MPRTSAHHALASFAAVLLLVTSSVFANAAPEITLRTGDPAPKLSIKKWVKGEPVKEFEKGKVYVIEFWATWCGPCVAAMPHVSELQAKYKEKGVVVIGVNIWERDLTKVEPFVEKQGDKMAYAVAMEEPIAGSPTRGRMATDWMAAAGRNGIPSSFIVDQKGIVAWMGHPMKMEKPLAAIVAGTYDPKAQAAFDTKVEELSKQASEATRAKEYDKAIAIRDSLAALDPDTAGIQKLYKVSLYMQKGDSQAAGALADELLAAAEKNKDGRLAANLAMTMLSMPGSEKSDPARALKAATLAYDLSEKSVAYQRLLAQAFARNGKFDKAIELQQKVVEATNPPLKEREQKVLDEYRKS